LRAAAAAARQRLSKRVRRRYQAGRQSLGLQTWGTKSFEFWTLLSSALWIVRPRSILELGSGRSTTYLGDYAQKEGISFASIEQNRRFAYRMRLSLRAGFVDPGYVHHVPIRGRWYDLGRVQSLAPRPCELLFLDGPVGQQESLGPGQRTDHAAVRWLHSLAADVRLLVVDDLQRLANVGLADSLAAAGGLEPLYLDYRPRPGARNVVMLAVAPAHAQILHSVCSEAGVAVYRDPSLVGAS